MLYNDDCLNILPRIKENSVDVIFADPPYFLSNGGMSIKSGKIVSVNKGEWDKKANYDNIDSFNQSWLTACYKILKKEGTIWVTGTHHNIFSVYNQMILLGFKVINIIVWKKTDPPPLIFKNKFKFSHEFIIWSKKSNSYKYNNEVINMLYNNNITDVWEIPAVQNNEKKHGYHPTQKPEALLNRIIQASSNVDDLILDPFMGSGTTGFCAITNKRKFIGIEKDRRFFSIAYKRINESIN